MYATRSAIPSKLARGLRPLYNASYNKFRIDEIYDVLIIMPTRALATVSKYFDIYVVDGLVRLTAWAPRFMGREMLSPLQGGLIQLYAWTTALGMAILLMFLLFY